MGKIRKTKSGFLSTMLLGLAILTGAGQPAIAAEEESRPLLQSGELFDFIRKPTPEFSWKITEQSQQDDLTVTHLTMVSQRWSPESMPSEPALWQHRMVIYQPKAWRPDTPAILHVNGGTRHRNSQKASERFDDVRLVSLAQETGSLLIELKDIPNQYLTINGERIRKEDDLIARSWAGYSKNPSCTECPLQMPMVRAVVKAMDTVQQVLKNQAPQSFIITGASKRGWATWLTAAIDQRVTAIIPMVIDVLDVQKNLAHSKEVYGRWILPMQPYLAEGQDVMNRLHTPEVKALMAQVDPWSYRAFLTLPKYVITASGDDFFLPDSSQFYWDGLSGPKWLRTYPNSGHYISRENTERVTDTVAGFVGWINSGRAFPELAEKPLADDRVQITLSQKPESVRLWQAVNPVARDFRMTTLRPLDSIYEATELPVRYPDEGEEQYSVTVTIAPPERGFKTWFVESVFGNSPHPDFVLTTPLKVISARNADSR